MAIVDTVLNYTGNSGLGLGSNPGIPVSPTKDLDGINDLGQKLVSLDAQRNYGLFQQKVKDQDELYKMLDSGKINSPKILDEDRKVVDDANAAVQDAWVTVNKNGGLRNSDAMRGYNEALQKARNTATQAQVRYESALAQEKELADSKLDAEREQRKANMDKWKGNFWGNVTPFVPKNEYDLPDAVTHLLSNAYEGEDGQPIKGTTTVKTGPNGTTTTQTTATGAAAGKGAIRPQGQPTLNEFQYTPGTRLRFSNIMRNAEGSYGGDPVQTQNIEKIYENFGSKTTPAEFTDLVNKVNGKLTEYNSMWGLKPGNPDYAAPITPDQVIVDPQTGERHFNMSKPELAAKVALASQNNYGQKGGWVFDKDQATLKEGKRHNREQETIDWARIGLDRKKLDFDMNKFREEQKGPEVLKNAALVYAANKFKGFQGMASMTNGASTPDGKPTEWILTQDDLRKMSQDDLNALGRFTQSTVTKKGEDGNTTTTESEKSSLSPFSIDKTSVIVLDNKGNIRVMRDAYDATKGKDGEISVGKLRTTNGRITGNYDPAASTNITGIATNRLMVENANASDKERNAFSIIDNPNGESAGVQSDDFGGSTTSTGTSVSSQKQSATQRPFAPKASYKLSSGKSISFADLQKAGYTPEQIQEAIRIGNLK